MKNIRKANLILNGEMNLEFIETKLKGQQDIYCVNGAYDQVKGLGLNIEAVIGDLDSIKEKPEEMVKLMYLPDQNQTDFEKALNILAEKYTEINIFGARGKQMDHFLGILSAAKRHKDHANLMFWDAYFYYFFAENETLLNDVKGRTISIFPFPEVKNVYATGLEYPVVGKNLELGVFESVRNKAAEDTVSIKYESGCAIIFVENIWK